MGTRSDRASTYARVPRQRVPVAGVAVLVGLGEESAEAIRYGARQAARRGVPVELVLPRVPSEGKAHCLAAMDEALLLARAVSPQLEVRVHVGGEDLVDWLQRFEVPVNVVVIGQADAEVLAASHDEADDPQRAMLSMPGCQVVVV